ncbi:MAG: rhomboid family intramembrane serine protease [Clostridia bacterium]|nr:rhomboid family intramembrane serine protease [Clostridia bacterium]
MKKSKIIFTFNAPAVLCFALLSLGALGLSILTGGASSRMVFSVYRSSFLNPLSYVRLFCHVLGHTTFSHYVSNMALILALGPIVEERYGSWRLLFMFAVTALVSGLFHIFFGGNSMLMGASGIVYMLIFLASTSGAKGGEIPLTLVAVAALYLTQEIMGGLFSADNISHLSHIVGGICGAVMGLFRHR